MFILRATQQVDLTVEVLDRRGNPAQVQNGTWASDDDGIVSVTDNGNNTATVRATGPVGQATVTYQADVDLGEGVSNMTATLDVEVVASDAAVFNITPGTAVEQEDDAPVEPAPEEPTAEPTA